MRVNAAITWPELCGYELTARDALRAAHRLQGLAVWWMGSEALELATARMTASGRQFKTPRLSGRLGCCAILLYDVEGSRGPVIESSFALPLRWVPGSIDHPRLPPAVGELAEVIRCDLASLLPDSTAWGLQFDHASLGLADVQNPPDLSGLTELGADSGWVPLAAGLLLRAAGEIRPDPGVWSTGAWQNGLQAVSGIADKIRAARRCGATSFFSTTRPSTETVEAQPAGFLTVIEEESSDESNPEPERALAPLLARLRLFVPTDDPALLQKHFRWLAQRDSGQAEAFYHQELFPRIVRRLRQSLTPQGQSLTHLVTIVSGNPELVRFSVEAVAPERVLLLHTADETDHRWASHARSLRSELDHAAGYSFACTAEVKVGPQLQSDFRRAVNDFAADVPPEQLVFDVTPGTGLMRTLLATDVATDGNWFLYCRHEWIKGPESARPFTEQVVLWQKGQDWETQPPPGFNFPD